MKIQAAGASDWDLPKIRSGAAEPRRHEKQRKMILYRKGVLSPKKKKKNRESGKKKRGFARGTRWIHESVSIPTTMNKKKSVKE